MVAGSLRRSRLLVRADLVLQAGDELLEQLVGDVLDDAPAELRRLAGDREVGLTSTRVEPEPSSAKVAVTVAPAVPLPRLSLPLASMTNLRAASSFSRNVPAPE